MVKRKDGLYQEVVKLPGMDKPKYFYGKTKAEVLRKINVFKQTQTHGELFSALADRWDTDHAANTSYNGHVAYRAAYKSVIEAFGDRRAGDITAVDINAYIQLVASRGYSKRTVQMHLTLLRLIFKFAIVHGECTSNPAEPVSLPKRLKTTRRELPTEGDIELVKRSVDAPFGLFAFFLLYTGCRRGEALALTYDDIDYDAKTITINKSLYWESNQPRIKTTKTEAGERIIILLDILSDKLPKGEGYLFGGNAPLTRMMYIRRWKKYVEETGVQFTPHQLRHLYATILYEAGIDEKMAQDLMGHASISITRNLYTHIRQQQIAKAAEMLNAKLNV